MQIVAAILAAGSSTRLGVDKTMAELGGKPVWQWSYETYSNHPRISRIIVVASESNFALINSVADEVVLGGETRQESARNALLQAQDADILLFHDAGRPFVTPEVISKTIDAILRGGAGAAAVPVKDTIREISDGGARALERKKLLAMQTPQGATVALWNQAFENPNSSATDDITLLENIAASCEFVQGNEENFKITTMEDLTTARGRLPKKFPRVGSGYDVHAFSDDPSRILMLGGVAFEGRALDGHSDADALLHAIVDSLLGAAGLGDIGVHFPNTDPEWKDCPSLRFVEAARGLLASEGWQVVNIDATVIAEAPKVMKKAVEIREAVAGALGLEISQISVKATTNEKLGFLGRSEGIAAFATAMIAPQASN